MATNYEILMSLSKKQMAAFIHSLVNKEVSRYIDWNAWLLSEDPEPPYRGEAAFLKEDDKETSCYMLEETDENGVRTRTVFIPADKGNVILKTVGAHFVRKASEAIYPAAPLPELDEEELQAAADESDLVLESLLSETFPEEESGQSPEDTADLIPEEKTEPLQNETVPEDLNDEPEIPEDLFLEPETQPEFELPEIRFDEPQPEPVQMDEISAEPLDGSGSLTEEEDEIPEIALAEIIAEAQPVKEEPEISAEQLPVTEEDDEPLAFDEPETVLPAPNVFAQMTRAEERTRQQEIQAMLFDDEEDDEIPVSQELSFDEVTLPAEETPLTEEPEEPAQDDEFDFDLSIFGELDSAVLEAEARENEATSSMKFDDLRSSPKPIVTAEEPVIEEEAAEPEEDEVVDFFDERDREAASVPDYYSRGRIEMLKESLFDDMDEPPLGTGDLVFQETTAIEVDRNEQKLPEAADLDEGIAFADVKIPEKMIETAKKAESTSSMELGEDEDADSFFDRFREMAESEPEDDATAELDLEAIKKESTVLGRLAGEKTEDEPVKTPEEEERDFRSDTLAMLLIDKKKTSMLYDPNDPEDQELPTIAFSAIDNDEEEMF